MCYFTCQANDQFSWFFLEKTKMATMCGDVTDLQQRHHPLNIPHIVGFPLKARGEKYALYTKFNILR